MAIERITFEDGDRFVIVYKNCDPELKKRILKALVEAEIEIPKEECQITEEEEAQVEPIVDNAPEMPACESESPEAEKACMVFPSGRYQGMTPEQVLEKDADSGYGNLTYIREKIRNESMKEAIRTAQAAYFKKRFADGIPEERCAKWTEEETDNFFRFFGDLMTEADKQKVMERVGAIDYDSYMREAPVNIRKGVAAAIITKYRK